MFWKPFSPEIGKTGKKHENSNYIFDLFFNSGFLRKNSLLYFQFWQEVRHSWVPKVRNLIFWKKIIFDRRRLVNLYFLDFCATPIVSVLSWKMHAIIFYNFSLEVNIIIAYYIDDANFSFVKKKMFQTQNWSVLEICTTIFITLVFSRAICYFTIFGRKLDTHDYLDDASWFF